MLRCILLFSKLPITQYVHCSELICIFYKLSPRSFAADHLISQTRGQAPRTSMDAPLIPSCVFDIVFCPF